MSFESDIMIKAAAKLEELAKEIGYSGSLDQLAQGLEVEKEHGPTGPADGKYNITDGSKKETAQIAAAHIKEIPDYYTRLNRMESGAKKKES